MNQSITAPKPLPIVAPWARPFWEAARQHKLVLQHCQSCDRVIFYPRFACPHCFSDRLDWVDSPGRGSIYTYTIVEANAPSAFVVDVPYVVAVVRLDEGVQILSNVVECELAKLRCDLPVEVTFERLNDEFTLPKFRPIKS